MVKGRPANKGKLLVRIVLDKDGQRYDAYENYTDLNEKTIMSIGYVPVKNYKEELRFMNTKVYMKMEGFKVYDIRADEEPNLETSSTLDDYFESDAQEKFMKGMSKVALPPLDMKKLGMIAIVGVGVVFGFLLLGGVL